MPRRAFISSTSRRHRKADEISALGVFIMRPCSHCVASDVFCVLSELSEKCAQCHRFNRPCDLASPWPEVHRLLQQRNKLREQRLEAEAKAIRLRKQERQLLKKARALGDRESKNIDEMEADELVAGAAASAEAPPPSAGSPGPTSPTVLS
jgi:hypothetical protein